MRIGYFVAKFPYSEQHEDYAYGGSIKAAHRLAIEMAKRGHDIEVYTTSRDSNDSIERTGNLTVFRYGTNLRLLTSNLSFKLFLRSCSRSLDIAHTHFDIAPSPLAGLLYSRKRDVPLVVTYHGDWMEDYGNLVRRIGVKISNRFIVDRVLTGATTIISPSESYIAASNFLGRYRNKIVVIPNGVDIDCGTNCSKLECRSTLGLPEQERIILFLGYLSPYKSPQVLVRALPKILEESPNTLLVFAGKGVMREALERLSVELGVSNRVLFAGFVTDDLRPLYMKTADVFCLPSTMGTECYPLAVLEAMACGTPVVASRIGGIPDMVSHGNEGLLVKPGDEEELANAILEIICSRDTMDRMASNAKTRVRNHTWSRIAELTERTYERIAR